jgi:hypothetical protein
VFKAMQLFSFFLLSNKRLNFLEHFASSKKAPEFLMEFYGCYFRFVYPEFVNVHESRSRTMLSNSRPAIYGHYYLHSLLSITLIGNPASWANIVSVIHAAFKNAKDFRVLAFMKTVKYRQGKLKPFHYFFDYLSKSKHPVLDDRIEKLLQVKLPQPDSDCSLILQLSLLLFLRSLAKLKTTLKSAEFLSERTKTYLWTINEDKLR